MQTEFPDYKRGPGFWFLFELLVAVDVCESPSLSAKQSDFKLGKGTDLSETLDDGIRSYERINKIRYQGW